MPIAFLHFLREHVYVTYSQPQAVAPVTQHSFLSMLDSLIFGASWVLYAIAAIIFCVSGVALHKQHNTTLGFITVVVLALLAFNVWKLHLDLGMIAVDLAIYVIAGVIWSVIKWWLHIKAWLIKANQLQAKKESLMAEHWSGDNIRRSEVREACTVSRNKANITNWIVYWPISLFITFTHEIFEHIYNSMFGIYSRIAAPVHAKLAELEKVAE